MKLFKCHSVNGCNKPDAVTRFIHLGLYSVKYSMAIVMLMFTFSGQALAEQKVADLYQQKCAVCHGVDGDGQSITTHSMKVLPTSFVEGDYKYRSTVWGEFPLDSDIEKSIRNGIRGGSMPVWKGLLTEVQIKGLAQYVKGLYQGEVIKPKQITIPVFPPATEASLEKGKKTYNEAGCIQCHGERLDGRENRLARIEGNLFKGAPARDLTDHRNYGWGASLQEIYTRIYTGLNGSDMQGYGDQLSESEIRNLAQYLQSIYQAKEKNRWIEIEDETVDERGEYLLSIATCELCHTPKPYKDGSFENALSYAGGTKVISPQDGIFYSRNLTSDMESGLGKWSVDEIKRAIRLGESRDGRPLYAFSMPWIFYHNMTDSDAEAIAYRLKKILPIYNKIPTIKPAGFWTSFVSKLKVVLGINDRILIFSGENQGVIDREKGKKIPQFSDEWHWSLLPPMGVFPADESVKYAGFDLPEPDDTGILQENAKRKHGKYLVSITPCTLCHTPTAGSVILKGGPSLSGGIRVSMDLFGTVYTSNLTPDPETGLGSWSDEEIRRSLLSGLRRDGSQIHFQAMPWPIFSNMKESDVEAIIAYLRSLPPVKKRMPKSETSNLKDYTISDHDFGITD